MIESKLSALNLDWHACIVGLTWMLTPTELSCRRRRRRLVACPSAAARNVKYSILESLNVKIGANVRQRRFDVLKAVSLF